VALKIAKVNPAYESLRLKKEVEMVAQLPSHPNIAYYEDCYTFASFDGEYDFGILQYYDRGNLAQLLAQGHLSPGQKQDILTQILSGIAFLHEHGIIHRDLKPQNILMVKRGSEYVPKITDFGISKQLDIHRSSVFSNSLAGAGTLAYASPEQLAGRTIRKNTDLWSFGVIAFQMLTGQLPFTTGSHAATNESGRQELFRQINSGQLPASTDTIAEPWQRLIRACLVTDSEQRVRNCDACKVILAGTAPEAGQGSTKGEVATKIDTPQRPVTPPPPPPHVSRPPVPRHSKLKPVLWASLGAIAGVILLFVLVGIFGNTGEDGGSEDVQWHYQTVLSEADGYFAAQDYAQAKTGYELALSQIPADDASGLKEAVTQKIAACDQALEGVKADRQAKEQKEKEERDRQAKEQEEQEERDRMAREAAAKKEQQQNIKKYESTGDFSEGLARVKLNGKWGYIDKTGKEVIPLKYDHAGNFYEGLADVKLNDKWGYIDKTGKEVIPLKYDDAGNFDEGLAYVKMNGKYGYIDKTGKEVTPFQYDGVGPFFQGLAPVRLNGKWGCIDKTGKEVIPLKYDEALYFSEGLAYVKLNGKYGYIDKTGKEVIPLKYDDAGNFDEGLAMVKLNGKWGYIDKTDKEVIPPVRQEYPRRFPQHSEQRNSVVCDRDVLPYASEQF
jgi:hypothetical protein